MLSARVWRSVDLERQDRLVHPRYRLLSFTEDQRLRRAIEDRSKSSLRQELPIRFTAAICCFNTARQSNMRMTAFRYLSARNAPCHGGHFGLSGARAPCSQTLASIQYCFRQWSTLDLSLTRMASLLLFQQVFHSSRVDKHPEQVFRKGPNTAED